MDVDTQQHLTGLRQLLLYRIRDLEAEVHAAAVARASATSEASLAEVIDRKDEAEAGQRAEIAALAVRLEQGELERCRRALHRLDQGEYGDCRDCGEPIPLARLMAQPEAERCAPCQAEREQLEARTRA